MGLEAYKTDEFAGWIIKAFGNVDSQSALCLMEIVKDEEVREDTHQHGSRLTDFQPVIPPA